MREGWEIKKLGDICTIKGRIGFRGYTRQDLVEAGEGAITLSPSNIIDNKLNLTKCQYISWFKYEESPEIKIYDGDIIYAKTASIGKVAIVENLPEKATINPQFVVLKEIKENNRFLYYTLCSQSFKHQVSLIVNGVAIPTISQSNMEKLSIPVPPVQEQEKIVAELDCLSGIIEKKKQQLKELDNLAQSIFYDMFGDPITNEKGWEVKEISSLFEVGSSKRVFESQWRDEGVPFYRAREIVRLAKGEPIEDPLFIEETMFQDYSKKYGVPKPGDMMITGVGTLGVCYIVQKDDRFYFKDGNIIWFKQKGLCETRFIKEQYSTDYVKNQIKGNANGATVGTYTITNANKTKVIAPPLDLQSVFVKKIEAIDQQKELIKKSIQETETLFNGRMDYWFN